MNCEVVVIKRWNANIAHVHKLELRGLSDSSLQAYGCCVYIKIIILDGTATTSVVKSKSLISPMRSQTIPKLELMPTLSLTKLINRVKVELSVCFNVDQVFFVGAIPWLHSIRFKVFERIMVHFFSVVLLNFIDLGSNPANIYSKGALLSSLNENDLWNSGPLQDSVVSYAQTNNLHY